MCKEYSFNYRDELKQDKKQFVLKEKTNRRLFKDGNGKSETSLERKNKIEFN